MHRIGRAHTLFNEVLPAWVVSFDVHVFKDAHVCCDKRLLSGGDDCLLKLWELSVSEDAAINHRLVSKTALAGVTSAPWHPMIRELFATGSYDECVRVWDYRSVSSGPLLELSTGM